MSCGDFTRVYSLLRIRSSHTTMNNSIYNCISDRLHFSELKTAIAFIRLMLFARIGLIINSAYNLIFKVKKDPVRIFAIVIFIFLRKILWLLGNMVGLTDL